MAKDSYQFIVDDYCYTVRDRYLFVYWKKSEPWEYVRVDKGKETLTINGFTIGGRQVWRERVVRGTNLGPHIRNAFEEIAKH